MPKIDPPDNQRQKVVRTDLNIDSSTYFNKPTKVVKHASLAHKEVIEKDIDIVDKMKEIQKLSKAKDEEDEN